MPIMRRPPKDSSHTLPIDTVTLMLSTHCNLACPYCYADGGSYGQSGHLMAPETACRALDLLLAELPGVRTIKLFGGEPLMNPEALASICHYVRGVNDRRLLIGLSTNGTLITEEIVDLLNEHRVATSISLDGPRIPTDRLRVDKTRRSVYNTIISGIHTAARRQMTFAIEATYTGAHIERSVSILDVVKFLNGFTSTVKVQPVMMCESPGLMIQDLETLREYTEEYAHRVLDLLAREDYHPGDSLYENFVIRCMLNIVLGLRQSESICQITRNITVFPNGDLCPCYLFKDESMGNIFRSPFAHPEFFQTWKRVQSAARAENYLRIHKSRLWYRPLIGDICLGELMYPTRRLGASPSLSPHLDLFYDTLGRVVVERMLELQEDGASRTIVTDNLLRLHASTLRWLNPHDGS